MPSGLNDNMKNILTVILLILLPLTACTHRSSQSGKSPDQLVGVVVSVEKRATDIGRQVLEYGGNAIDAAVAVGFVLAVTYPKAGNIGGGGFMVIRLADGTKTTIDYREKAPLAATRDMYLDSLGNHVTELSEEGYLAVGVPGSVAGMLYALEKYGSMERSEIILPSYTLANDGIIIDSVFARSIKDKYDVIIKYPATADIFLKDTSFYDVGELFVQKDLALTLRRIMELGTDGFYSGITANFFEKAMSKNGGIITKQDLSNYQPVERDALTGTYKGYDIIGMPPASSGGIVLMEILNIIESFDISNMGRFSPSFIRTFIEASKYSYADRAAHLGDSDFYPVPIHALISKEYALPKSKIIQKGIIIPSDKVLSGDKVQLDSIEKAIIEDISETTHYSVIDRWGNAVSVTTTLNSYFGAKVVVEGTGIILNNEMDDFSAKAGSPNQFGLVHGEANEIEPGKRMLSSMTPTIVEKDGKVVLITGSPGGSRIISTTAQVILNYIDFKMDPEEAVTAPRIHHQWKPDILYYENDALTPELIDKLTLMGYELEEKNRMGSAQTIGRKHNSGILVPAPDRRRGGYGAVVRFNTN